MRLNGLKKNSKFDQKVVDRLMVGWYYNYKLVMKLTKQKTNKKRK